MDTPLDLEDHAKTASGGPQKTPEAQDTMQRHKLWCMRGAAGCQTQGWRSKKQHRIASKKCLRNVDWQLQVGTQCGGLKHFVPDEELPVWKPARWADWPYLMMCLDQGSDQQCGYNALQNRWGANVDMLGDFSHGANRDTMLGLHGAGLKQYFQLLCMSFNLPFGPMDNDGWADLMLDCVTHLRANFTPETAPLFMADSRKMKEALVLLGVELPGLQDADVELFEWALDLAENRRNGSKVTACRFQAQISAAELNLLYWWVDKWVRTRFVYLLC